MGFTSFPRAGLFGYLGSVKGDNGKESGEASLRRK